MVERTEWGYEERSDTRFMYVKIHNPIELGAKAMIGAIIVSVLTMIGWFLFRELILEPVLYL